MDLNDLTPQEIVALAYELTEDMDKEAGADFDLNDLSPEEIVELGYYLADDMEKEAGADFDLNKLSVDEFLEFAADLEEEMEKEAGVKEMLASLKGHGKAAGSYMMDVAKGGRARRGYADTRKYHGHMKRHSAKMKGGRDTDAMKKGYKALQGKRTSAALNMLRGGAETSALYGAPAAGAVALYNRRKNRK